MDAQHASARTNVSRCINTTSLHRMYATFIHRTYTRAIYCKFLTVIHAYLENKTIVEMIVAFWNRFKGMLGWDLVLPLEVISYNTNSNSNFKTVVLNKTTIIDRWIAFLCRYAALNQMNPSSNKNTVKIKLDSSSWGSRTLSWKIKLQNPLCPPFFGPIQKRRSYETYS